MNNAERIRAILHYQPYDRMPVVHFGFWEETLDKWYKEGHITKEECEGWSDGNQYDRSIGEKLGFDFNWYTCYTPAYGLYPGFEEKVVEHCGDGYKFLNANGVIILKKEGVESIPIEFDHVLKDRKTWEEDFKWRLEFNPERIDFDGYDKMRKLHGSDPIGLHCGSLFGQIRDWMGFEAICFLYMDDEELYDEIIDTVGELEYKIAEAVLDRGLKFDFGHFWEDICFKSGPLVVPSVFEEKVAHHYKRITSLLNEHGIDIVSLDCDGVIDSLAPIWLENGVNTMFPLEYGTWKGELGPLRESCGKELRAVGGMNKNIFALGREEIDREIGRLKPMIEMGGFIPCPDHRIPPEAIWENVQYYCSRMREIF